MSSSHFSRTLLDACYLMLFATLWRNELEEGFYSVFGRTGRGNKKVCVTNWGKWRGGKQGGIEEGERRWGQGWGNCVLKKKMQSWRVGKSRISTHANTPRSLPHTHTSTHTHTCTPVHRHPMSVAVAPFGVSSVSECHTGQSLLSEQRLPVALRGYYMV